MPSTTPQDTTRQPSSRQWSQPTQSLQGTRPSQQIPPRLMPIPSYTPSSASRSSTAPAPPVQAVSVPAPLSPLASTLAGALHPHHHYPQGLPPRQYHYQYQYQHQSQHQQQPLPTGAGVNTGAGVTRPKTEAELEADRLYEEAMEDEYAKRDGGS